MKHGGPGALGGDVDGENDDNLFYKTVGKYGENTTVNHRPGLQRNTTIYVQNTVHKRPFTARLHLFTEDCKLSLGYEWLIVEVLVMIETD